MSWIRVHDQLKDLLMSHFTEHLPVGARSGLSYVHIRAYCGGSLHQVLKFDETCNIPKIYVQLIAINNCDLERYLTSIASEQCGSEDELCA
jgi:hypothetical protein